MAKDTKPALSKPIERAVRFRFNQHSFSPIQTGAMGEVKTIPADIADKLKTMGIGDVLPDEESNNG